ncbi:MAG TPA: translational GTPase TypA, partial [Limnochordia bacterium]|nr:translational GTPase TypA [Limnochordia bacterium]
GIERVEIGDTITDAETPRPLPPLEVDEPTLAMIFRVNDSPLAGRDGEFVTSRQLRERLLREVRQNVALRVTESESPDAFEVAGRGELHLGILIETMRREGYEMCVSRPRVVMQIRDGEMHEPLERLIVEVPAEHLGTVMEQLGARRADLVDMRNVGESGVRLEFIVPARGLIGFRSLFLTETRGYGIMHHTFEGYGPLRGEIPGRQNGSLVAWEDGAVTSYALENAQARGRLFVDSGEVVYEGMVVGEHSRPSDLDINVAKKKHVTNMRSSTSEVDVKLEPPVRMSLEQSLSWIADDEWVEVTPVALRLRKAVLKRSDRQKKGALVR